MKNRRIIGPRAIRAMITKRDAKKIAAYSAPGSYLPTGSYLSTGKRIWALKVADELFIKKWVNAIRRMQVL
jgi:hypothetical protein